uniref:Ig-like domain-containing protein n=1 Tax=Chrysemys picta bellii TaxID=8478 RepID=A0A8C3HJD1_CHRPI
MLGQEGINAPLHGRGHSVGGSVCVCVCVGGRGDALLCSELRSRGVSLRGTVAIWCEGPHRGMRFVLNKERRHFPPIDATGFMVVFSLNNESREEGGSYSCYYHSIVDPFNMSYPSDPMELVVRGEGPSSASPFPAPPPARPARGLGDVTVRCWAGRREARFSLFKVRDRTPLGHAEPAGVAGEFLIHSVRWGDGGRYTCYYQYEADPFAWSEPSDPVELVVAGEGPGSVMSPFGVGLVAGTPGSLCLRSRIGPRWDAWGWVGLGEFLIRSMRRGDGGSYTCYYHYATDPFAWSEPSDPEELVVAGEGPNSVSRAPSGGVILGGAVTIHCRGWHQNETFLLYKDGNPNALQDAEPAQDMAEFPISNVSQGDAGSYSCRYSNNLDPPVWSEPSNRLELLVVGERSGSVSLLLAPQPTPGLQLSHPPHSSRQTLVLFPQGELTRLSREWCWLPPTQAAQGQVPGLVAGNLHQSPPETGLCCPRICPQEKVRRARCVGQGQIPKANAHLGSFYMLGGVSGQMPDWLDRGRARESFPKHTAPPWGSHRPGSCAAH